MLYVKNENGEYIVAKRHDVLNEVRKHFNMRTKNGLVINNPQAIIPELQMLLGDKITETFLAILVNNQNKIVGKIEFHGAEGECPVYPKNIIRKMLELGATGAIVSHNHPTGKTKPSHSDNVITKKILESFLIMDLRLLDHIIVGANEHFSYTEHGLI